MVVQQKLLEKAYFIIKPTGRAVVRPASSDKWKAPQEWASIRSFTVLDTKGTPNFVKMAYHNIIQIVCLANSFLCCR